MPITKFICKDGSQIELGKCISDGGCPFKSRCMARPMLKKIAIQREWKGIPSTTQLLKGTRQAYLEIVNDFSVKPDDRVFMILGTTIHNDLEGLGDATSVAEIDLSDDEGSVRPDLLECEKGEYTMLDYKVTGSFVITGALGLYKVEEPMIDPETGEPITYKKDGKGGKKGEVRMHQVLKQSNSKIDLKDWPYQLNNYRVGLETKLGIKIKKLTVQAIVRDGGTAIAVGRGVVDKSYQINVPILPDDMVKQYFLTKKGLLLNALKLKQEPPPCSKEERWYNEETKMDKKCTDYCSVNRFCSHWKEKYQADITTSENWDG